MEGDTDMDIKRKSGGLNKELDEGLDKEYAGVGNPEKLKKTSKVKSPSNGKFSDEGKEDGDEKRREIISYHIGEILKVLGEDVEREGLRKTPQRYANALLEILSGYNENLAEILNDAIFSQNYNGIVTISNIRFFSMCEHHILPFFGVVSVSYIPDGRIIGLSKIPRVVKFFSSRLQVQERLTEQIGRFLEEKLNPKGVAVYISALHLCLAMRGAKKEDAKMETLYFSGEFRKNPELQSMFLEHVRKNGESKFFF